MSQLSLFDSLNGVVTIRQSSRSVASDVTDGYSGVTHKKQRSMLQSDVLTESW